MNLKNIFESINIDKNKEEFIDIFTSEKLRVERIVSNGQKSDNDFWYKQEESEFIVLLEGFAILEFENSAIELKKGDFLNIESNRKHRVKYTSENEPTIWLAIFY